MTTRDRVAPTVPTPRSVQRVAGCRAVGGTPEWRLAGNQAATTVLQRRPAGAAGPATAAGPAGARVPWAWYLEHGTTQVPPAPAEPRRYPLSFRLPAFLTPQFYFGGSAGRTGQSTGGSDPPDGTLGPTRPDESTAPDAGVADPGGPTGGTQPLDSLPAVRTAEAELARHPIAARLLKPALSRFEFSDDQATEATIRAASLVAFQHGHDLHPNGVLTTATRDLLVLALAGLSADALAVLATICDLYEVPNFRWLGTVAVVPALPGGQLLRVRHSPLGQDHLDIARNALPATVVGVVGLVDLLGRQLAEVNPV